MSLYMMFRVSLTVHHFGRITSLSFRHATVKTLPSLTAKILTPELVTTGNCTYSTLFSSVQSVKLRTAMDMPQTCVLVQLVCQSTKVPLFYAKERDLNKEIMSKYTVQEQLAFYQGNKEQASLVNKITVLHCIAKISHKYKGEKEVLQKEREKVKHGKESAYIDILNFIAENISSCKAQGLANVMWALGRIGDETHSLVRVCEEEILSHDFALFHTAEINQILTGCAGLGLKDSQIFDRVQESILNEVIRISTCESRQMNGILLAFAKMGRGSAELFNHIEQEIIQRSFKSFHNGQIAQFLYTFATRGIHSDILFEKAEEEILRRSTFKLRRKEIVMMLWAFATADKGSVELFTTFDNEIVSSRIKELYNTPLMWIIWSFATRGMTNSQVFKVIAEEIYKRGLQELTNSELSLCLYSYALSEIPCKRFLKKLETELLARDLAQFEDDQLSQVAWACGKAGLGNPNFFCRLEEEILQWKFKEDHAIMIEEGFCNAEMGSQELFSHLQAMTQQSV